MLSADSHLLLELDEKGEQVSFMTLLGGFNGLKKTIPRAEGVTMDEAGTLYMVSEPNLFYRFEKNNGRGCRISVIVVEGQWPLSLNSYCRGISSTRLVSELA